MNSMTIMTTFSVKNENTIPNMYSQSKNMTIPSNEKDKEDKIIVYNIEKDFLIPMLISPIQNNKDILTAVFYEKKYFSFYGDSITLEKNDIYYESVDSFSIHNELTKISKINDLSVLYTIKGNIEDKYNCCGCTACASICAHDAITMTPDSLGFLCPKVPRLQTDIMYLQLPTSLSMAITAPMTQLNIFSGILTRRELLPVLS